jgi:hypothetical protein
MVEFLCEKVFPLLNCPVPLSHKDEVRQLSPLHICHKNASYSEFSGEDLLDREIYETQLIYDSIYFMFGFFDDHDG